MKTESCEARTLVALAVGVGFGVLIGAALLAAFYPLFQSKEWAAWVQAIGAIAAIIYSYIAGGKQVKAAKDLQEIQFKQRSAELQSEIDRLNKIEQLKADERRENSYAEASLYRVNLRSVLHNLNLYYKENKNTLDELKVLETNRKDIFNDCLKDGVSEDKVDLYMRNDQDWRRIEERISYIKITHNFNYVNLKKIVDKLAEIPRREIRSGDSELASKISSAINNIQTALLGIRWEKEGGAFNFSILLAIQDIDDFLKQIERSLVVRNTSKTGQ